MHQSRFTAASDSARPHSNQPDTDGQGKCGGVWLLRCGDRKHVLRRVRESTTGRILDPKAKSRCIRTLSIPKKIDV